MYRRYKESHKNMAGKLQIGVVISSTRENRIGERVVKFVKSALEKKHNVVIFDIIVFCVTELRAVGSQNLLTSFHLNCTVMDDKLTIGLVISSTRENRLGNRVVKFVKSNIEQTHNVVVFDPLEIDLPKTQQSINFMYNPTAVPEHIKQLNEKFKKMDALVIVCAEYNWSIPPALTNLLDNIPPTTLCWKPCANVAYSISPLGGSRATVQLRTFEACLGLITVPCEVTIPKANETITEDGQSNNEHITKHLTATLEHLYWAANAFKTYSAQSQPPQWVPS